MITKEKFQAYEGVRSSGLTNMFDIKAVMALSCAQLTKEDCLEIMKNYSKLNKQYPDVRVS